MRPTSSSAYRITAACADPSRGSKKARVLAAMPSTAMTASAQKTTASAYLMSLMDAGGMPYPWKIDAALSDTWAAAIARTSAIVSFHGRAFSLTRAT